MALQGWEKPKNQEIAALKQQLMIEESKVESLQQQLMISGKGGSPGQPYDDPEKGKGPFVPAPPRDKLAANNIVPTHGPLAPNDDDYGEGNVPGHPDWKLAGGPQLPNFKPMGRVIKGTREGVRTFDENKITRPLQIGPQAGATSRQIRDRLKGFTRGGPYDDKGGSLRGVPDALRIQLLRDAMAQNLPANNIRRLRDSGHKTDYTGGFRLGDDGKLHPVMGIIKADASNNIRRLNESGHQTVFDPVTGQLKIVKTL